MYATIFSLFPSVFSIILALTTKEIYFSLIVGILSGAFLSVGLHPVSMLNLVVVDGFSSSVSYMAGIFCFLVFLGSLLDILRKSILVCGCFWCGE